MMGFPKILVFWIIVGVLPAFAGTKNKLPSPAELMPTHEELDQRDYYHRIQKSGEALQAQRSTDENRWRKEEAFFPEVECVNPQGRSVGSVGSHCYTSDGKVAPPPLIRPIIPEHDPRLQAPIGVPSR
ncbi:MAG: hypothetical protein HY537_08325 [Deltaproteobacteria bacterium]|nr:hypothetical protein [Deltaproteobacteria bacterium]